MTIDLTEATDRVRLNCGDTSDLPYLDTATYQYCLDSNDANENAATRMAAQLILAQLSYGSHQRLDKIEQWGSEAFENYLKYIKQVITNPMYASIAGIYVAGMLKDDVAANNTDTTIVQHKLPVYPYEDYNNEDERTTSSNLF